ncbi:hypothetical protein C0J52_03098 [Blattella germanica]|nr:hypothetical protein C0J52_03098 [Blattella germanica]
MFPDQCNRHHVKTTRWPPSEETPLLSSQTAIPRDNNNMTQIFCHRFHNCKFIVYILSVLFGLSAWISINGMFVQLPLMVQTQPENWNLPSYLSVIIQIANIGPILYSFCHKFAHNIKDAWLIYILLILGSISLLLLTFFYQETTIINGSEHSTALFVLSFFGALVGCTSSVLFMPYMGNFREVYLISYFIGEGLSGFLPSIVALIQGVGGNPDCIVNAQNQTVTVYTEPPKFSTEIFYWFLFATMSLSTLAFFLLNTLDICQSERTDSSTSLHANNDSQIKEVSPDNQIFTIREDVEALMNDSERTNPSAEYSSEGNNTLQDSNINDQERNTSLSSSTNSLSRSVYFYYLILASWVCMFGNGFFPSIQSYSCLPYGNVPYHLSVTLGSMANPVACFIAFFYPYTSLSIISILTSVSTIITGYILTTALLSPEPPLVNSMGGEALVVVSWVIVYGLITYVKVSIATVFRQLKGRSLFWCGAVQQMGSAIGAIVAFFLINYTEIFTSYNPCANVPQNQTTYLN